MKSGHDAGPLLRCRLRSLAHGQSSALARQLVGVLHVTRLTAASGFNRLLEMEA
jgi:hypothetical protein